MKIKTSELSGQALNWATAKAAGIEVLCWNNNSDVNPYAVVLPFNKGVYPSFYCPSTNWLLGGPIIEREEITVDCRMNGDWQARIWSDDKNYFIIVGNSGAYCKAPLIAAMRCYVASKLGSEVDIPKELL